MLGTYLLLKIKKKISHEKEIFIRYNYTKKFKIHNYYYFFNYDLKKVLIIVIDMPDTNICFNILT